jgi:hypothetical protein
MKNEFILTVLYTVMAQTPYHRPTPDIVALLSDDFENINEFL